MRDLANADPVVGELIPKAHDESMLGVLKKYITEPIEPITDWQAVKEEAWAMRATEIVEALRADSERHRDAEGAISADDD